MSPLKVYAADNTAFCHTVTDISFNECLALMSIYDSTGGDNWTDKRGWGTSTTVCGYSGGDVWAGIRGCVDNHVSVIDLSNNNLSGNFSMSQGYLLAQHIDLSHNQLTSFVGGWFSGLQELYLNDNQLTSFDGNTLNDLQTLDIYNNKLVSFNGADGMYSLKALTIFNNLLTTPPEIPSLSTFSGAYNCFERSTYMTGGPGAILWLDRVGSGWELRNSECPALSFCETIQDVPVDECLALMSIYNNTGGDNWASKLNWGVSQNICRGWHNSVNMTDGGNIDGWSGVDCEQSCTGEERVCNQVCTPVYDNVCNQVCDENGENCYDDCQDVYSHDDCQDVCTGEGIACTYNVKNLVLNNNNLTGSFAITTGHLDSFDPLYGVFNLSNNHLTSFDGTGMSNLRSIDLSHNAFTSFEAKGLNDTQELILSNNQLTSFNTTGMGILSSVDLSFNNFTSFSGVGLSTDLTAIYLSNNQLTSFDGTGLTNVSQIDLSNNQLTSFDGTGMNNLSFLGLNNNQLTSFDGTNLPKVIGLHLSNNQLTSFDGTGMNRLYELHLDNNLLSNLQGVTNIRSLYYLYTGNNCFHPTSLSASLITWLNQYGVWGKDDWTTLNTSCPVSFCSTVTDVPETECEALMGIYENNGGVNWSNNTGWGTSTTVCGGSWSGVTCSNNHIVSLDLSSQNVTGTFGITRGNLGSLLSLNLSNNRIVSFDGTNLNTLTSLSLDNNLINSIQDITAMTNLGSLHTTNNCLVPSELDTSVSSWLGQYSNDSWGTLNASCPVSFCSTVTDVPEAECGALMDIYNSNGGDGWDVHTGWGVSQTVCSWEGITCADGHVTKLNLGYKHLAGDFAIKKGNLDQLTELYLYNNSITSFSNAGLGKLTTLNLNGNQITSFSSTGLSELTSLNLSSNKLTSFSSTGLGNLISLWIGDNKLTSFDGTGLNKLTSLTIWGNKLTSFSSTGLDKLTHLTIGNNKLTSFDSTGFSKLVYLNLWGNQLTSFSGSNMNVLATLDISENLLTSFNCSGMNELQTLTLADNHISSFNGDGMALLRYLYLSGNILTSFRATGMNSLNTLDLSGNQLTVFDATGLPTYIQYLSLQNNKISSLQKVTNLKNVTVTLGNNCLKRSQLDAPIIAWLEKYKDKYTPQGDWEGRLNGDCPTFIVPLLSTPATPSLSPTAIVTWNTDVKASSIVEYGLTASDTSATISTDTSSLVTDHNVVLPNLAPCITYDYRVRSTDASLMTLASIGNTFTTAGCVASAPIIDTSTEQITASTGGTITLKDESLSGMTLTVPPAFSVSDANFQSKQLNKTTVLGNIGTPIDNSLVKDLLYELKAATDVSTTISTFNTPLTMSMTYEASDIVGLDEASLKIYSWDGAIWSALPNCVVDTGIHTVTCTTTHFSVFGLFGKAVSSGLPDNNPIIIPPTVNGGTGVGLTTKDIVKEPVPVKTAKDTNTTTLDNIVKKAIISNVPGFATRLEAVMFALKTGNISLEKKYTCLNLFTDITGQSIPFYTCQVAEKARAEGIISQTNKQFNPMKPVSRIEAYAIMMKSICVMPVTTDSNWQSEVIKKAIKLGFTARTLDTFEPERPLTKLEMYTLVQKLSEYGSNNKTCSL